MTTPTSTSTPASIGLPPILLAATPTGVAGSMSIDLAFSTAMAAGSGTITITDGAVQTVIDRATGKPTQRVVGATDTHVLSAADVHVDGSHVRIDVAGLLAGHTYSVLMGAGVLMSSDALAFGGVRGASQVQFSTPTAGDTTAPTLVSASADGSVLKSGGSIGVMLKFSEAIKALGTDVLSAPNASVSNLSSSDGGVTWHVTLTAPSGAVTAASNLLTIDMGKVQDLAGHAGSGSAQVASYAVDTQAPTAVVSLDGATLAIGHDVLATIQFSEAVKSLDAGAFAAGHATISNVHTADGGVTWTATLSGTAATTADGNLLSVDLSKVQDLAGNTGSGSAVSGAYKVDTAAPTVTQLSLDAGTIDNSHAVGLTVKFSEAVSGLTAAAFTSPHAAVSNLHSDDDGLTWTGTLMATGPAASSGNLLSIDASKVHDLAGNTGSGSASAHYDVAASYLNASVTVGDTPLQSGGTLAVTIHFSGAVDALDVAAISAPHANVTDLQVSSDHLTWTATLRPDDFGIFANSNAVTLDLARVHDRAGHTGLGPVGSNNYVVDTLVQSSVSSIDIDDTGPSNSDGVTNDNVAQFDGTLSQPLGEGQHVELTIDGEDQGPAWIDSYNHWRFDSDLTLNDGNHVISAQVVDEGASHASAAWTTHMWVDSSRPDLLASPDGQMNLDTAGDLVFRFDEPLYANTEGELSLTLVGDNGTELSIALDNSHFSADRKTITIGAAESHLAPDVNYHAYLPYQLGDLAGNSVGELPIYFHTALADASPARALSIVPEQHYGPYGIGAVIQIDVTFSKAVHLVGASAPVIQLDNGGQAVLQGLSADGLQAHFNYTIGAGDRDGSQVDIANTSDLVGHFADTAGNILDLAHVTYEHLIAPGGYGLEIDTHAPVAPASPVLAAVSDSGVSGDNVTAMHVPALKGSGAESYADIKLYVDGALVPAVTTSSNADGSWSISPGDWLSTSLTDGPHSLTVKQYDHAGNASPASDPLVLTVDTVAPGAPGAFALTAASDSGISNHDGLTNNNAPVLTGSAAEAGGTVKVYEGVTLLGAAPVGANKVWSLAIGSQAGTPSSLAEGVHHLSVVQVDAAGNAGTEPGLATITIDTTAPAKPGAPALAAASDSGTLGDDITNVNKPTLSGSAPEAGGAIEVYEGDTLLGSAAVGADKSWSFTIGSQADRLAAFADGVHTLTVKEVDAAGNRSVASDPLAITIDTVAPTVAARASSSAGPNNFYDLQFSESVVFSKGEVDVLDGANNVRSQHTWDVMTNWALVNSASGTHDLLQLTVGSYTGPVHLQMTGDAITDVAGNVAIIGSDSFNIPGPTA